MAGTDGINLREQALLALLAVEKEEMYSHKAIAAALDKYRYLPKQERSFFTRLCEGTLERQLELDYIIGRFSSTPVERMKPPIRCILRMGVYQLKYMDAVPPSAACNEAVKLAVRKGFGSLRGFVNGVLRNISRNLDSVVYPDETKQQAYAWSIRYSIPEWILKQWAKDYGWDKAKSIAQAFQEQKRMYIRVNRMKTTPEELKEALARQKIAARAVKSEEYPALDCAMEISGYDSLWHIPEFLDGHFMVQDFHSMLAACVAAPKPGDFVIDVCAAPGGKSLYAAEQMQGMGMVEARDLSEYKVGLIEENQKRCGILNLRTAQMDARALDEASIESADLVIADLPCSGLGVLGRKSEIRYRMTKEKEESLVCLQREILTTVCQYVKPGGTLLYSTCTMNRMENEENRAWFLEGHPQFALILERQLFPDEGDGDGFYMAKFIRR